MNNQSIPPVMAFTPSDDDIRVYAYQLYQRNNCTPGQDLDNWLEATACLQANIPAHLSGTRLHRYLNGPRIGDFSLLSVEARILAS